MPKARLGLVLAAPKGVSMPPPPMAREASQVPGAGDWWGAPCLALAVGHCGQVGGKAGLDGGGGAGAGQSG